MIWRSLVGAALYGVVFSAQSASAQTDAGTSEESEPSPEAPPAEPSGAAPAEQEVLFEPTPTHRPAWEAYQAEQQAKKSGVNDEEPEEERPRRRAGIFSKGTFRPTIHVGRGGVEDETYLILGAGLGYYVIDGLAPALSYDVWLLGDPTVQVLTPELTYVFYMVPSVKPYVGPFLRHYFIAGRDDLDTVGVRGGLIIPVEPAFFGVGGGYEVLLDCDSRYQDCDNVFPEFLIGATF